MSQNTQRITQKIATSLNAEASLLLAAIVESSDDAIMSKSVDGTILSWNKGAQQIYGYTPEEVIGQPVSILMPESKQDDFPKMINQLKKGKRIEHYETQRKTKDGRIIDVSITVSPLRNRKGEIIGASKIARDITYQKEIERKREDFISMASHELKTPITSIKGFAQILQRLLNKLGNEDANKFLDRMLHQIDTLTNLVSDLLDASKVQQGKLEYKDEKFDIDSLIEDTVENIQQTTNRHSLKITGKVNTSIKADKDRIGQVLVNLLTNAIKYSPQAKEVLIYAGKKKGYLEVSVQDFGIGINKQHLDKIFDKFYRVTNPDGDIYPGLGIGLYISNEIIKRHKGQIYIHSEIGKGSTFTFNLPLK